MQPGERIDIIRRVATRLAAEGDYTIIDLILEQFDLPIRNTWSGSKSSYVIDCLKDAHDDRLTAIDHYLMGQSQPTDEPWETDGFRLFLSHISGRKKEAHSIKSYLRFYGIDAFVAHDDIPAGREWEVVLRSALNSCNALAALLHDGFRESPWCDQEVGFALGRGLPIVPVEFDLLPYGFIGSVQAVRNADNEDLETVANSLVKVLLEDKRSSGELTEAIVKRLCTATFYDQANGLSRLLDKEAPLISSSQVERLREAEKENNQLQGAFDFDHHVSSIEAKISAFRGNDETPF